MIVDLDSVPIKSVTKTKRDRIGQKSRVNRRLMEFGIRFGVGDDRNVSLYKQSYITEL